MKKISADFIFPISGKLIKNGIIHIKENGKVIDIIENNEQDKEVEHFKGIIVPGFVNTHTHLELSHLEGKFKEGMELKNFVKRIKKIRNIGKSKEKVQLVDNKMWQNGTVAVGDICNDIEYQQIKNVSEIYYYNFIECFGIDEKKADEIFERAVNIDKKLGRKRHSITPHSIYGVSCELIEQIIDFAKNNHQILSLHFAESIQEKGFLKKHDAYKFTKLIQKLNIKEDKCLKYFNELEIIKGILPPNLQYIFVHNTIFTKEDITILLNNFPKIYFAICIKSNLFLTNKLPDINMLDIMGCKITIGTDSLATNPANSNLSILEELKTISNYFPNISLEKLLLWATKNGAEALGMSSFIGTIEKGKTPRFNLITNIDYNKMQITKDSQVKTFANNFGSGRFNH